MSDINISINNKMARKETIFADISKLSSELDTLTLNKNKVIQLQEMIIDYLFVYCRFPALGIYDFHRSSNTTLETIDDEQITLHREKIFKIYKKVSEEVTSIENQINIVNANIQDNHLMVQKLNDEIIDLRKERVEEC